MSPDQDNLLLELATQPSFRRSPTGRVFVGSGAAYCNGLLLSGLVAGSFKAPSVISEIINVDFAELERRILKFSSSEEPLEVVGFSPYMIQDLGLVEDHFVTVKQTKPEKHRVKFGNKKRGGRW